MGKITALENFQNTIQLQDIHWPVWKIGSKKPEEHDGLVFIVTESLKIDSAVISTNYRVIDDKNLQGKTLQERRLQLLKNKSAKLYPLRDAFYFLGDFIKVAKPKVWFIDSQGRVFNYKKFTRAKLQFLEIEKIIPSGSFGFIVCLKNGLRFKVLYKPFSGCKWAGILVVNKMPILYGVYVEKHKETWRSV